MFTYGRDYEYEARQRAAAKARYQTAKDRYNKVMLDPKATSKDINEAEAAYERAVDEYNQFGNYVR